MANGVSNSLNQLFTSKEPANIRSGTIGKNVRGPAKPEKKDTSSVKNPFGDSVKVELSPEVEMYGKVVDLLQKKYDNADVFVAGPDDDLSQIGGDLEYSIILSEDEMKLLASDDPKDKEAKDKLLVQIDDAMKTISDMSSKISESTDEKDEISNFGITFNNSGKLNFFADINGSSFKSTSVDDLISSIVSSKTKE
ncbi:hypothetical protein D6855_13005 [Butyrivibrio sp. CB08]|uniref:DUF6033 family protein n=1 Tax=Butyrivibrio sp. CB08 TaxID=2364879 RepID=UPI000EA90566|nr:DUF6033 family protein [Butyrivibrio sp. CB08]RKM57465.1 hypothetical protein D6855_13005 [Butyrivibrio sp. CB08]